MQEGIRRLFGFDPMKQAGKGPIMKSSKHNRPVFSREIRRCRRLLALATGDTAALAAKQAGGSPEEITAARLAAIDAAEIEMQLRDGPRL
jgi:hypothetical protein